MGTFAVSFHVRTTDVAAVDSVLADLDGPNRRTDAGGDWITVFDERASLQDPARIVEVATGLSAGTDSPTVAFLVHDSDVMQCWVARAGAVSTHLDSWPGFPEAAREPHIQDPDALLALCDDLDRPALQELLGRDVVFADDQVHELAGHLGIQSGRALGDYRFDDDESASALDALAASMQQTLGTAPEPSDPRSTALIAASDSGDLDRIRTLVGAGTPVDEAAGWSPPAIASGPAAGLTFEIAATPLFVAASRNQAAAVRLLVELGADPNARIPQGSSPLAAAAGAGNVAAVEALLAAGADPHDVDASGMTPADAVDAARQQFELIRTSMAAFADLAALPFELPDGDAMARCAALLRAAMES